MLLPVIQSHTASKKFNGVSLSVSSFYAFSLVYILTKKTKHKAIIFTLVFTYILLLYNQYQRATSNQRKVIFQNSLKMLSLLKNGNFVSQQCKHLFEILHAFLSDHSNNLWYFLPKHFICLTEQLINSRAHQSFQLYTRLVLLREGPDGCLSKWN